MQNNWFSSLYKLWISIKRNIHVHSDHLLSPLLSHIIAVDVCLTNSICFTLWTLIGTAYLWHGDKQRSWIHLSQKKNLLKLWITNLTCKLCKYLQTCSTNNIMSQFLHTFVHYLPFFAIILFFLSFLSLPLPPALTPFPHFSHLTLSCPSTHLFLFLWSIPSIYSITAHFYLFSATLSIVL